MHCCVSSFLCLYSASFIALSQYVLCVWVCVCVCAHIHKEYETEKLISPITFQLLLVCRCYMAVSGCCMHTCSLAWTCPCVLICVCERVCSSVWAAVFCTASLWVSHSCLVSGCFNYCMWAPFPKCSPEVMDVCRSNGAHIPLCHGMLCMCVFTCICLQTLFFYISTTCGSSVEPSLIEDTCRSN